MTKKNENVRTRRTLEAERIEVRKQDDGGVAVAGYAAVFGQRADIGGWFTEEIERGAFDESLAAKDDVQFLIEHCGLPLARNTSGTLTLAADDHGLKMETTLRGDDPDVRAIVPKMERGDLDKMSVGFFVRGEEWEYEEEPPHRKIKRAELFDVSIVGRPAYEGTEIALRNALEEERERVKGEQSYLSRRGLDDQVQRMRLAELDELLLAAKLRAIDK